jgi:penicillin-binding protein 2
MTKSHLSIEQRFRIGVVIAGLLFGLFAARMIYLQTFRHEALYSQSENNRIRLQPVIPKRGVIYDRDGRIIVGNRAAYSLSVVPVEMTKMPTMTNLARLLETDVGELERRMRKSQIGKFQPALIKRDIGFDKVAILEEQNETFPGAVYRKDQTRHYVEGLSAECFTGYVGEISAEEVSKLDPSIYRAGRIIGKTGIEKSYDRVARGLEGTEYIEIAASGQLLGAIEDQPGVPAQPGSDLVLTIDLDIQQAAAEVFGEFCCGAVVVIDPRNGEILAMVSKPSNDANVFSTVMPDSLWRAIVGDSTNPLLNRPLDGVYPPGSTYKLVLAGAALEAGIIDRTTLFSGCGGGYRFGNRVFKCWLASGHGRLPVVNAIERSCDVFFYQLGYKLGLDNFAHYSRACGFGRKTGIDLPQEASGNVPSKEWYDRRMGPRGWTQAVLLNLGIGQGEMLCTPLQLAQFYCGLANQGRVYRPHLVKSMIGPDGRETAQGPELSFKLPFSEETLRILNEGLWSVVNGNGTARGARIPGFAVAGKTGTAQNPHGEDHAWFVGYAPAERPEIVACVIIENAGHGSEFAAPAVRKIIQAYLDKKTKQAAEMAEAEAK